jgi:hypothetical protein
VSEKWLATIAIDATFLRLKEIYFYSFVFNFIVYGLSS